MKLILAVFVVLCLISNVVSFANNAATKAVVKKVPTAAKKKAEAVIVSLSCRLSC